MFTTSVTLLERLHQPAGQGVSAGAWTHFVRLYTPLLYHWARRLASRQEDADDLVQEVFAVLIQKLPEFTYDPDSSFRSWLRTILLNKWRDQRRRQAALPPRAPLPSLADLPSPAEEDIFAEAEYQRHLLGQALELMQADFQATTWAAFREHGLNGRSAAEVAAELGISIGAVYAAKFRVIARLRENLRGLLN